MGIFGIFEHRFCCKIRKNLKDFLVTLKKLRVSQSRNTMHKKFGQGRDSNPRPSAWQTSKKPNKPLCQVAVEVTRLEWQLVEATASLIKLVKSVTSLVLKKQVL